MIPSGHVKGWVADTDREIYIKWMWKEKDTSLLSYYITNSGGKSVIECFLVLKSWIHPDKNVYTTWKYSLCFSNQPPTTESWPWSPVLPLMGGSGINPISKVVHCRILGHETSGWSSCGLDPGAPPLFLVTKSPALCFSVWYGLFQAPGTLWIRDLPLSLQSSWNKSSSLPLVFGALLPLLGIWKLSAH